MDDIKLAGKKQNLDPMWKVLNKEVDLGEPTSFLDHVYMGCTQRECERSKDIVDNYRTLFESRISAGGLEKLPFLQHIYISSWSYGMAGHAKKCVEPASTSESPEKTKSESQNVPLTSLNVQQTSTGRPVLGASSSNYSEWNIDNKWSSQVWKSCEMLGARTVRPVDDKFVIDDDMDSNTATESDFSF